MGRKEGEENGGRKKIDQKIKRTTGQEQEKDAGTSELCTSDNGVGLQDSLTMFCTKHGIS